MLFCSWNFAHFFLVVFAVYWLPPWRNFHWSLALPGRSRWQWTVTGDEVRIWWLLAASFYFYASWNRQLALLICLHDPDGLCHRPGSGGGLATATAPLCWSSV